VRTETELPNQRLPDGAVSGYTLRGFGVSYGRAIGTRLNFNGSLSQVEITPFGGNLGPRSGLNGSASLTLLASDRLQFVAFANRNFTSTLTSTSTYQLVQGYGLTANYAANDRLRLRLGGQYSPRRFFYAVAPAGPFIGELTQYDIFGGITYNLNRRLRLNLDGGYQRRDADLAIFAYDSVYAAVGISVSL
uniref:outer membrane beta-barrel protein n=1 Tax=uncultured Arthrobacter sp. TaxID=114050 RepID=UPI003217D86D